MNSAAPQTTTASYWTRRTAARNKPGRNSPRTLQVGAAELQRLLDLLAQRKELAHRKEREAPRG